MLPMKKTVSGRLLIFGTVGLETSLPLMLTNLVLPGKMSWSKLAEVMSINPRRILRLEPVTIAAGSQADLTLIDLSTTF